MRGLVLALCVWSLFWSFANAYDAVAITPGTFGMETDSNLSVERVYAGGPAAKSGVRLGDRVDRKNLSLQQTQWILPWQDPSPGEVLSVTMIRAGSPVHVTLVAQPAPRTRAEQQTTLLQSFVGIAFALLGSWLVLVRPSMATWGLFAYCIGVHPGQWYSESWLAWWFIAVNSIFRDALNAVGHPGLMICALRFPNENISGWRKTAERFAPFIALLLALTYAPEYLPQMLPPRTPEVASRIGEWTTLALDAFIIAVLALTFVRLRGVNRQRVGWVLLGLAIGLVSRRLGHTINTYFRDVSISNILSIGEIAIPLGVAYTVLKFRAFNVGFVANRAIVYGAFGGFAIALILGIDWVTATVFASSRLLVAFDVATALLIGYALATVKSQATRAIDRIFLPKRYERRRALDVIRDELGARDTARQNIPKLIEKVANTLDLSSLALFERLSDGGYLRAASLGWPDGCAWHVMPEDPLTRVLRESTDGHFPGTDENELQIPLGEARPTIMIFSRSARRNAMLVGSHRDGSEVDNDAVDQIRMLLDDLSPHLA